MYGLTRGAITLIGVIVAGFLIWLGVEPLGGESTSEGEYWWAVLMCALAGLVIALSQLLGGWTKWGWPRLSLNVFLLGFLPALIAGGWALLYAQPEGGTMRGDIRSWSEDLGIEGLMDDLSLATLAIAFALGLIFGLTFDTTGPMAWRRRDADEVTAPGPAAVPPRPAADEPRAVADEDDRRVRIREEETRSREGETRSREGETRSREGETRSE